MQTWVGAGDGNADKIDSCQISIPWSLFLVHVFLLGPGALAMLSIVEPVINRRVCIRFISIYFDAEHPS